MTPAELAVNNAISFECKKDALTQKQSGDWRISFTVQGVDMDARLTGAAMGTRFVAVLVAINDDEMPTTQAAKEKIKPETVSPKPSLANGKPSEKAKREPRGWQDTPIAQQAGILVNDPTFGAYLRARHFPEWRETSDADSCIKFMCGVTRKRDIASNHTALVLWNQIVMDYRVWGLAERVGA